MAYLLYPVCEKCGKPFDWCLCEEKNDESLIELKRQFSEVMKLCPHSLPPILRWVDIIDRSWNGNAVSSASTNSGQCKTDNSYYVKEVYGYKTNWDN